VTVIANDAQGRWAIVNRLRGSATAVAAVQLSTQPRAVMGHAVDGQTHCWLLQTDKGEGKLSPALEHSAQWGDDKNPWTGLYGPPVASFWGPSGAPPKKQDDKAGSTADRGGAGLRALGPRSLTSVCSSPDKALVAGTDVLGRLLIAPFPAHEGIQVQHCQHRASFATAVRFLPADVVQLSSDRGGVVVSLGGNDHTLQIHEVTAQPMKGAPWRPTPSPGTEMPKVPGPRDPKPREPKPFVIVDPDELRKLDSESYVNTAVLHKFEVTPHGDMRRVHRDAAMRKQEEERLDAARRERQRVIIEDEPDKERRPLQRGVYNAANSMAGAALQQEKQAADGKIDPRSGQPPRVPFAVREPDVQPVNHVRVRNKWEHNLDDPGHAKLVGGKWQIQNEPAQARQLARGDSQYHDKAGWGWWNDPKSDKYPPKGQTKAQFANRDGLWFK